MAAALRVLIDGAPGAAVPVSDRGFQYGDGLFETLRLCEGRIPLWAWHRDRLHAGAERLGMAVDFEALERELETLIADDPTGVLRITLTRGDSERGYAVPRDTVPRRVLALFPPPEIEPRHYEHGVRVRLCETRLAEQPRLAGLKHLNRLEQVLARREWAPPDFHEGLMCDTSGRLVEGTFTNLFLLLDEELVTPPLGRCGVAGVMRRYVIEERPGLGSRRVAERELWPEDLHRARECFLTNSVIGLWPVRTVVMGAAARAFDEVTIAQQILAEVGRRLGFDGTH